MLRTASALLAIACAVLPPSYASADNKAFDGREPPECQLGNEGCFLARDGTWRQAEAEYRALTRRGKPHHLRASLEMSAALTGGILRYALDPEARANWDFPSIKDRFTLDAWRYDNNTFAINHSWHAISGLGFHLMARENDISLLGSVGYGVALSTLWEFGVEFRENVSINDMILTPVSGVALGEFLHWFWRYLESAPDTSANQFWRYTLGLPRTVHTLVDGKTPERDGLIWHRFRLGYSVANAESTLQSSDANQGSFMLHHIDLDAELVALPGYLQPGRIRYAFAEGNLSRLHIRSSLTGDDTGLDIFIDTMLLGIHRQNVPTPGEARVGRALTVGSSIAFRYRREELAGWKDRLGIVHLPGLAANGALIGDRWLLRGTARLHADFVGVHSLPFQLWNEANPEVFETTILRKQGYYFGVGWSGRLAWELSLPHADLGGSIAYGHYYSDEGLDRQQDELEVDLAGDDRVLDYGVWLRLAPFGPDFYIELRLNGQERKANLAGFSDKATLRRYAIGVGSEF